MKLSRISKNPITPLLLSSFALVVRIVSFLVSYLIYKESKFTNFNVTVAPSLYSPLEFVYFSEYTSEAYELEKSSQQENNQPVNLNKLKKMIVPPQANLTFLITVITTNNSRRALPIKRGYYYLIDQKDGTRTRIEPMQSAVLNLC